MRIVRLSFLLVIAALPFGMAAALDQNANQQSDVWEIYYGATALSATGDADKDGFTNAMESAAGTNPFDPNSRPLLGMLPASSGYVNANWASEPGTAYDVEASPDLSPASWVTIGTVVGDGSSILQSLTTGGQNRYFFRLKAHATDSDGDGLSDWEELKLGLLPGNSQSQRLGNDSTNTATTDLQDLNSKWNAASTITVGLVDGDVREDWPDKGVIAIRRSGGVQPVTVNVQITGTATRGGDYTTISGNQITVPLGARETWIEVTPVNDASVEGPETVIVSVTAGAGYTVGSPNNATVTINDASALPSAKAAARFLIQAAFGPDQDDPNDADIYPENVEEVMAMGFDAWITDQFARPIGYIQPWVDWVEAEQQALGNAFDLHGNWKEFSWWGRAMGTPKLRPDAATTQLPDVLRQRVAFALSEIVVAGDRPEAFAGQQRGFANFYDLMIKHAFGSYRDLLYDVATHPVMGTFLSHLNNQKANPAANTYPDENFAREIMQLFSIGLWQLNQDGSRVLVAGQPVPTYSNADITEMARVFTGMTFADKNFPGTNGDFTQPMKMVETYHDFGQKSVLGGQIIPARVPNAGTPGVEGLKDVSDAVNILFNHPSIAPFVCKQLIQRMVTSNPSAGYISRVAGAFINNGSGVRGDMKAVVRAILMDTEARDPAMMDSPTFGKLREPFLRVVNFARAFNAFSTSGHYALDQFNLDHLQDPMNSPSVFNFFLPAHSPPGPITQAGLVAPEFQIINASTAVTAPNYFWNAIDSDLHRYGHGNPDYVVKLNSNVELAMIVPAAQISADVPAGPATDPDPLIRRLDLALTGGTLTPRQFQTIREAVVRIGTGTWQWHRERLRMAIYLIVTSAEYNVLR
ncbi:MAG: DUF1800 family protein [Verrucomicrobiaceae bacterium]|nr:DUF1800 family protein [Verrucomicrobiaceae bacterium]